MSKKETLLRISVIIRTLKKSPSTLKEIQGFLKEESEIQEYNLNVTPRTFQRDLEDIRSLYNINIEYDFRIRKYRISNIENDSINTRLLEAFDTFNVLNVSAGLSEFLEFEHRKASGLQHFYGILHALKNHLQLNVEYQSYLQHISSERKLHPFLLKEFRNRWYLIAKDIGDDRTKTFALDRISNLIITKKKYTPIKHELDKKFKHSFGIISSSDDSEPQLVILSFSAFQGRYVKSLPLHHTQEILVDNENEFRVRLKVFITFDFEKELLSFGDELEVIEPFFLRNSILQKHKSAFERYIV